MVYSVAETSFHGNIKAKQSRGAFKSYNTKVVNLEIIKLTLQLRKRGIAKSGQNIPCHSK